MHSYNQIYGDLSVGAGSWMDDKLFKKNLAYPFSKQVINSFKKVILKDLKRINLHNKIKNMDVMDVGSGRQSIALLSLGAKSVDHYDISANNIKRVKKYCKNINNLKSYQKDICLNDFNKQKLYDFIYLQGIIQHTKIPEDALKNVCNACKTNGIIWLYHYQPTSLNYFYVKTLRKVFRNNNLVKLEKELIKLNYTAKLINFLMDDIGCDYIHFKNPNNYKKIMEQMGFVQFYRKNVTNLDKGIKFNNLGACLTAYKKMHKPSKKNVFYKGGYIDIYDIKNYKNKTKKNIRILKKVDKKVKFFFKKKKFKIRKKIEFVKPIIDGYMNFRKKTTLKEVVKIYNLTNELILLKEK